MQLNLILQYPEFFLCTILGVIFCLLQFKDGEWHFPHWLGQAAVYCFDQLPQRYRERSLKLLIRADWRSKYSLPDFAGFKLCLPLLSLAFSFVLPLWQTLIAAAATWALPDLILTVTVKRRQREIQDSLAQALDLMVLCIDAGLGLDATLQRIASEGSGITRALNDELGILGHEIFLGKDRERAYVELYTRTGVDELKTLGSALGQASKLGLSISKILRAQGELVRKKQGQRAEEKALKMPIYMAFPLWLFIMPSLMLLVLGPSLIKFYHAMSGTFGGN